MQEIDFKATKVFSAIHKAVNEKIDGKHKYKLIVEEGGSRSSKTWSNFQVLFLFLMSNPASSVTVLRDTQKSCRDIVEKDFRQWLADPMVRKKEFEDGKISIEQYDQFIKKENLTQYLIENKTNHTWTFKHNNNQIWFTGLDDENLAMGMTQTICWINEPYDFSQDVYKQLAMRSKVIIFDWNPKQSHWVESEKAKETTFVHYSTFKDNPFILPETRQQILSYQPLESCELVKNGHLSKNEAFRYDCTLNTMHFEEKDVKELRRCQYNEKTGSASSYDWDVYGLGLKSEKPNKIYNGWNPITPERYEALKQHHIPHYGLDFGFANPSACVEVLWDGDVNFYIREKLYKPMRLMLGSLGEELLNNGVPSGNVTYIFCDSSDKEAGSDISQINDLRVYYSLNAVPVEKPTYKERFDFITKMKVHYCTDSKNLIEEYQNYEWEYINGYPTERPIKKNDHLMNAMEYCMWMMKKVYDINF